MRHRASWSGPEPLPIETNKASLFAKDAFFFKLAGFSFLANP